MKKLLVCLNFFIIMMLIPSNYVHAFNGSEHDEYMREVLFGETDAYYKSLTDDDKEKKYINALQDASYLCLDYYNGTNANIHKSAEEDLKLLDDLGVKDLPDNVDDDAKSGGINFSANAQTHRNYTHKGWDYNYSGTEDKANWPCRKKILQNTVQTIFGEKSNSGVFSFVTNIFSKKTENIDSQYDDLAAIIYYIHVLGDQIDTEDYEEEFTIVPFVAMDGKGDVNIIDEFEKHFESLFASQKKSGEYKVLMLELKKYKDEATEYADVLETSGGLYDKETYDKYRDCEKAFMDSLKKYVPPLLQEEEFFRTVFKIDL